MLIEAIIVFILMLATDFVWAISIKAISDEKLVKGGLTAAMIVMLNGFAVISYVKNPVMIIPAAIGAFTGVLLSKLIKR